jgi:hypothetical protein
VSTFASCSARKASLERWWVVHLWVEGFFDGVARHAQPAQRCDNRGAIRSMWHYRAARRGDARGRYCADLPGTLCGLVTATGLNGSNVT